VKEGTMKAKLRYETGKTPWLVVDGTDMSRFTDEAYVRLYGGKKPSSAELVINVKPEMLIEMDAETGFHLLGLPEVLQRVQMLGLKQAAFGMFKMPSEQIDEIPLESREPITDLLMVLGGIFAGQPPPPEPQFELVNLDGRAVIVDQNGTAIFEALQGYDKDFDGGKSHGWWLIKILNLMSAFWPGTEDKDANPSEEALSSD